MEKVATTCKELLKLDFDAIEAYEAAIERIQDGETKHQLEKFLADHQRHTEELGQLLRSWDEDVPEGPDAKRILTEGKVVIAGLGGDKEVLRAMQMNEKVTNKAYEEALEIEELPVDAHSLLSRNLEDEQRHKAWIESKIEFLKAT